MATVRDIMNALGDLFPWSLTLEEDNSGLQIGDPGRQVSGVVCTVGVDAGCIDQASNRGCELIVSHHPLVYPSLDSIDTSDFRGSLALGIVESGLSVVSCHTNADMAVGGTADLLADMIGLSGREPIIPFKEAPYLKLVVFVPKSHTYNVMEAVSGAGAGWIGDYSHCTFRVEGEGTFLPQEGTSPHSGRVGELNAVEEIRLESTLPSFLSDRVVDAMITAHPYEQVAYDLYSLSNPVPWGMGRIGVLEKEKRIETLKSELLASVQTGVFREVGAGQETVERVAVVPGSAGSLVEPSLRKGADLLICGEISYHRAVQAGEEGMGVFCLGHLESERPLVERMVEGIDTLALSAGWDIEVIGYRNERTPWRES